MKKALDHASKFTKITQEQKNIINHAKKSLLIHENQHWTKKGKNKDFDVTMGSMDGAESCVLVGAYLLSLLSKIPDCEIGLYRDDGLVACRTTQRNVEKIKKTICAIFKEQNLKITIEANKKIIDFLDISLNLNDNTYKPYTKPGNNILYVHKDSNHPPAILKNIPKSVNKRLNEISSNEKVFLNSITPYQEALQKSGYGYKLKYKPPGIPQTAVQRDNLPTCNVQNQGCRPGSRHKNVTWYNPSFNCNVKTNIGKQFLNIVKTCFDLNHPLRKIFNSQSLKLSYSCMPNLKSKIDMHNKRILNNDKPIEPNNLKKCNCRVKNDCPLENNCLQKGIVYQAEVCRVDNSSKETYVGLCDTEFKTRYNNHKSSFKLEHKKHQTELSKHIWKLKEQNLKYNLKWKIIKKCKTYSNTSKRFGLHNSKTGVILSQ